LAGASLALAGIYFTVSDVDQRPPAAAEG